MTNFELSLLLRSHMNKKKPLFKEKRHWLLLTSSPTDWVYDIYLISENQHGVLEI
jgi:hypothetical protein